MAWNVVAAIVVALFFLRAMTCEDTSLDPAEHCTSDFGTKAGIAVVIWLVGLFLILAISNAGRARAARAPKQTGPDPLEQIERLATLRESGAISDEEYEEKKAALLRQME